MGLVAGQQPFTAGSRQGALIGLQVFFVTIALCIYLLRVYTRAYVLRSIGSDDCLMGVAVLFSIGLAVNACISTRFGWGLHVSEVPPEQFGGILLCIWISELLFTLSTTFVKLSILIFYLRIAITATYRKVIYGSIAFMACWGIVFCCVVIFQCHPVGSYWDPNATQCLPPTIALFMHGLTNTVTDIYVYVLPMRMVWKTQLPKGKRIGLLIIFGVGFLVCVAGALRLYYSIVTERSNDAPWEGFNLWTWESIEVNLGIICASAPCLKALISRFIPTLWPSRNGTTPSATAGAQYPRNVRRNPDSFAFGMHGKDPEAGYILGSIATVETGVRGGKRTRGRGESEDDLTDGS